MTGYTTEETKRYIAEVRALLNSMDEVIDDAKAMEVIEKYVFDKAKAGSCSHGDNARLIQRIFLSIRSEMDILQPYVDDPAITEIMVNGKDDIFIEQDGQIRRLPLSFSSTDDLEELIRRIAARVHREINDSNPVVDARLSDGSRINAVFKNVALNGPILTIRKFPSTVMTMDDLVANGTLDEDVSKFLVRLVKARYNCLISGGTSSGKTTMLNVLSQFIPSGERIVVIEDSAELQIEQVENIVRLECRNANSQGKGAILLADLVRNSLRMRPDRIIIGEVRGKEVIDMIQAMNTGHSGSMSTGHANSTEGMVKRLEAMFLQAADIPVDAIRNQIAEGMEIMIHLSRDRKGRRRLVEISELDSVKNGSIHLNRLYHISTGFTGNPMLHPEKLEMRL